MTRAPVREALIDIQFEPRVSLAAIQEFAKVAEPSFARNVDLWEAFIGFETKSGQPQTKATQSVIGKRLDSDVPPHVLQCRTTGFTFSRLSPYGEWNELREEGRRWWIKFQSAVRPATINRIAVRYINEIKLPLQIRDFGDYLTCPPQVPSALPQGLSGFLSRNIIPDEENDCVSIITQALEGQPNIAASGAEMTVLLDVDVYRSVRLDDQHYDEVWLGLDALRNQKNRMFFEHLTERAVEMFL